MLAHGHFQNIKQSSKYLFHDVKNSVFILYFLPMLFLYLIIIFLLNMLRLAWHMLVPF